MIIKDYLSNLNLDFYQTLADVFTKTEVIRVSKDRKFLLDIHYSNDREFPIFISLVNDNSKNSLSRVYNFEDLEEIVEELIKEICN